MKNEKIYFVSHPDDDHTPLDYEQLVTAAKKYHVALELNNSSLTKPEQRWNCVKNYEIMLKLCQQYEVPIIVNSDAHDPSWVGKFSQAAELLERLNFNEELILNIEVNRVKEFIDLNV